MGPGEYDTEKADAITRVKTTNVTIDKSARKANLTTDKDSTIGPGQYEEIKKFGEDTTSFRIGEKRTEIIRESSVGPGAYDLERADKVTRTRTDGTADMGGHTARNLTIVE